MYFKSYEQEDEKSRTYICARENGRYSKISDFDGSNQMSDWMSDQMLDRMLDRMLDGLQCNVHCNLIQYWVS